MRSDARRRRDRKGHTRSHICEKSLMPLARTAPSPASPFTESGASRQARSWVYVGSYPPQPQTTISNSKYVTPIVRTLACVNRAVNHGLKAEAPSRYPVLVIDRLRGL
jgi:hypothetical protein